MIHTSLFPVALTNSHSIHTMSKIQQWHFYLGTSCRILVESKTKHVIKSSFKCCINSLQTQRILTSVVIRLQVIIWSPMRAATLRKKQVCDSSLDCDRLQPAQHLLKSLSGMCAEFQCCDWLSGRRNDVIHSEQWLYLYKTHSARHVPGEGRQEKLKLENAQWGEYILCSTCWSWLMEGLRCHLLLKRIRTETLCRGSAESTDSSWIQEEDTWAMLAESTINWNNTWKHSDWSFQFIYLSQIMYTHAICTQRTYNDRRAVFEVFRPYRAHTASQLS